MTTSWRVSAGVLLVIGVAHADDITDVAPSCDPDRAHCFAIQLHVAADVTTPAWIAEQIAFADRQFAAVDVGFQIANVDRASIEHVVTRADRDALAAGKLAPHTIHVFIVGKLDDIDTPGDIIYGVTWRAHDIKYLIVSAQAWQRTLAHELGHFFGLPHSTYDISIMNKSPRSEPPLDERRFADDELAAMRPVIERMAKTKALVEIRH
jgi:hypothetical protein